MDYWVAGLMKTRSANCGTARGGLSGLGHSRFAPLLFAVLLSLAPAVARADVAHSDSPDFTLDTTGTVRDVGGVSQADSADFTLNTTGLSLNVGGVASADSPDFTLNTAAARLLQQNALSDITTLSAGVISPADSDALGAVIASLKASTDSALWVDGTHLAPKHGDKVFQYEKDAVNKLHNLAGDKRSSIPAATLQDLIAQLVTAARLLAVTSVQEEAASLTSAKKIAEDQNEIALGDANVAGDRPVNAIEHYRNAWTHAIHYEVKSGILATSHGIKLHFVVFPGDTWVIQASTNTTSWVALGTFTADADGVIEYDDPASVYLAARYYRVVTP